VAAVGARAKKAAPTVGQGGRDDESRNAGKSGGSQDKENESRKGGQGQGQVRARSRQSLIDSPSEICRQHPRWFRGCCFLR